MKPKSLLLSSLAAIAGLAGCKTTESYAEVKGAGPAQIFHASDGLGSQVSMQNFLRAEVNGLLEAQVDLKNNKSGDLRIEYMFEWFDARGFKIESSVEHWTPATLNGNHIRVVRAISPKPGADSFRIHVRRPHEVTR